MKSRKALLAIFILILAVTALWLFKANKVTAPDKKQQAASTNHSDNLPKEIKDGFRVFSGEEFAKLYDAYAYPNTQLINEHSPITGNEQVDKRIRELALAKGYKLRSAPVTNAFVEVQKGMMLQRPAAQPWLDMQAKAKTEGFLMSLSDAYRAAEDQRGIFLDRLKGISFESIGTGAADNSINKVLEKTAAPGYSRHHTGYTIDIVCDNDPNVRFEKSKCFTWLSKDNYLNAKKYGWIPSYPEGAGKQGPEPEAWEYVWVGTKPLQ